MTELEKMLQGHMYNRATRAWRMAGGDREAALAHLEAMCGQDWLLAGAVRREGLRAALKAGRNGFDTLVRTAGQYLATHPRGG